jgi:hypothetical protein
MNSSPFSRWSVPLSYADIERQIADLGAAIAPLQYGYVRERLSSIRDGLTSELAKRGETKISEHPDWRKSA